MIITNSIRNLIVSLLSVSVVLSVIPTASSENKDSQRLQSSLNIKIDSLFASWNRKNSPGCAVGVIKNAEMVFEKGYGIANLDWGIPISPNTVFYVGSISKQFTAAAIAILVLENKIDLDTDIRTYLPEMRKYKWPVSVRQLVHHTAGIRGLYRAMNDAGMKWADQFSDQQALDLLAGLDLDFKPGSQFNYSNGGYQLLALIVERASGMSLREFSQQRIFEPLGMLDTHFHDDSTHIVARRAMSYEPGDKGYLQSYLGNFERVGQGGLYTTLADLARWDKNFYTNSLAIAGFSDLQHTVGILNSGEKLEYAFGLRMEKYRGEDIETHSGGMMGFLADFIRVPAKKISVLVLCNGGDIPDKTLSRQVLDLYLNQEVR